jgi:hypothetical protein
MGVLDVRSHNEAMLFVLLRDCDACGALVRDITDELRVEDASLLSEYTTVCRVCGNIDSYVFRLPEHDPQTGRGGVIYGGDDPSTVIDAGEWLDAAEQIASGGPAEPDGLTPPAREAAAWAMTGAAAAVREVLKFIPPGADRVPPAAVWTERGQERFARDPVRMRRAGLEVLETMYRESAERLAGEGQPC